MNNLNNIILMHRFSRKSILTKPNKYIIGLSFLLFVLAYCFPAFEIFNSISSKRDVYYWLDITFGSIYYGPLFVILLSLLGFLLSFGQSITICAYIFCLYKYINDKVQFQHVLLLLLSLFELTLFYDFHEELIPWGYSVEIIGEKLIGYYLLLFSYAILLGGSISYYIGHKQICLRNDFK